MSCVSSFSVRFAAQILPTADLSIHIQRLPSLFPRAALRMVPGLAVAMTLASISTLSAAAPVLATGEMHLIQASDPGVECEASASGDGGVLNTATAECSSDTTAELFVERGAGGTSVARVRYSTQFQLSEVEGAAEQSFVPIHVRVPNMKWAIRLSNTNFIPSYVQFNVNLRLFELLGGDPSKRDAIGSNAVYSVTLANGDSACSPGNFFSDDPIGLTLAALACFRALKETHGGHASPTISAVVQAGGTYSVEIEAEAIARKEVMGDGNPVIATSKFTENDDVTALEWQSLFVTVGTDAQAVMAGHTHDYKTGRGSGHNKVDAETSPPSLD